MRLRINQLFHAPRWLWGAGIGLVLTLVVVVSVVLVMHNRALPNSAVLETSKSSAVVSSSLPTTEPAVAVVETSLPLPRLEFAPGSVEEACGFNELPTYTFSDFYDTIIHKTSDHAKVFESAECQAALEAHMSTTNPQQFLSGSIRSASLAELVVLAEPFTFERIFADPTGDLLRVQDALSNPECLLTGDETNWELKETCNAAALLNYAFVNLFCFGEGIENRIRPINRTVHYDNPTLEQDRILWKQELEDSWVVAKCTALDPTLEFSAEHYPELYALVISWDEMERNPFSKSAEALLVELAARLGDGAAGLSQNVYRGGSGWRFKGEGYKFGRVANLIKVEKSEWVTFASKREPQIDRFLQIFHTLARLDSPKSDPKNEIKFDWKFVARHLCEPPYFEPTYSTWVPIENVEHSSCKEIVHEIRQKGITFPPLVKMLDKFEQVALELGVYE